MQVGHWVNEYGGYVDAAGRPVDLPDPNSGRAVTPVESEGARIGILIQIPLQPPARPSASQYRRRPLSQRQRPPASGSTRPGCAGTGIEASTG